MPIPFMPTHSNCSEKEKIHWISTTIVVIDKENTASGVPFADSFCVNERMIITQVGDNTVTAHMSYEIVFKPGASLKGILKSAADK
jgi:CRISPR/Cas system CMR subunit Cmr6 (Cas7 group RAMP superfamily)